MKRIYIHGLGQTASSWNPVLDALPVTSDQNICLDLSAIIKKQQTTYSNLYAAFADFCDTQSEEIVLCGLSLGSVLALHYAIDHPDRVKALILIAPQYKMPKHLLKIQNMLFRCMPKSMFKQTGFDKNAFIALCSSMADLDFRKSLNKITCPVSILCGEKDKANKKAANELSQTLKNAQYQEINNASHEVNVEAPVQLATLLHQFYSQIER